MIRKSFKIRPCTNCGEVKGAADYSQTRSDFFNDGRLPICNRCLDQEIFECKGNWDTMDRVCQWANVPFVPEQFTKIYASTPRSAASTYLKYFFQDSYSRTNWKEYEDRWSEAIKNNNEKIIHPIFNQQEMDALRLEWGNGYSQEELYTMDKYFKDLKKTFGVSDAATEKDAKTLAKLSIEIDRNIAEGAVGIEKLVSAYNKVKDSGGFSSDKASGANEFSSVSELMYYLEEHGWTNKFIHNDEVQDVVDQTIQNIQGYVQRLYQNEPSMQDQIEARIEAKKKIDRQEKELFNEIDYSAYEGVEKVVDDLESTNEDFDPEV